MMALAVFTAKYLFALAPAVALLIWWRSAPDVRRLLLWRGVIVLVVAVLLAKGGGALYHEPRPFVIQHVAPLIPHAADNGFPSDHTLVAGCCAGLLAPVSLPAAGVAALAAVLAGSARVACRLHSPLDIAAALVFAVLANGVACLLVRRPLSSRPAAF